MLNQNLTKKHNLYWFLRSFFLTLTVLLCFEFLIVGIGICYAVMESNLSGKEIKLIEKNDREIKILGKEIIR